MYECWVVMVLVYFCFLVKMFCVVLYEVGLVGVGLLLDCFLGEVVGLGLYLGVLLL